METVFITVNDGIRRHENLNCKKCQEAGGLLVHSMDMKLARELRIPVCDICKGTGKVE